jgi:hypothetical protein
MVTMTSLSTAILCSGLLSLSAGKSLGSIVAMISGLSVFEYMGGLLWRFERSLAQAWYSLWLLSTI